MNVISKFFYYIFARGVPGILNYVALIMYTRLLTPEEFGKYALVMAVVGLIHVIVFQWQQLVAIRFLPTDRAQKSRFRGGLLAIYGTLSIVVICIGSGIAIMQPDPISQTLVLVAIAVIVFHAGMEINLALVSAELAPGTYGRLLGVKSLVALAVGTTLAFSGYGGFAPLLGIVAGIAIALLLIGLPTWRVIRPMFPGYRALRQQLAYGLPLVLTFALAWIINSSDRLLIVWLLDNSAAGQYSAAYDLNQYSIGLLVGIVHLAAYPLAVHQLKSGGASAAHQQVGQNGELVAAVAISAAVIMSFLAPQIAHIFVGSAFRDSFTQLTPWIAFGAALAGIKAFHCDIAFHLGEKSRGLVIVNGTAAVANIVLNILLIPYLGILGAAIATVSAFSLGMIASLAIGSYAFALPSFLPIMTKSCCVAASAGLGTWLGSRIGVNAGGLVLGAAGGLSLTLMMAVIVNLAGLRQFIANYTHCWLNSSQFR